MNPSLHAKVISLYVPLGYSIDFETGVILTILGVWSFALAQLVESKPTLRFLAKFRDPWVSDYEPEGERIKPLSLTPQISIGYP